MRMKLWNSLSKKVQCQTFQRALQHLESRGIVAIDEEGKIFYTGVNNQKPRGTARVERAGEIDQ